MRPKGIGEKTISFEMAKQSPSAAIAPEVEFMCGRRRGISLKLLECVRFGKLTPEVKMRRKRVERLVDLHAPILVQVVKGLTGGVLQNELRRKGIEQPFPEQSLAYSTPNSIPQDACRNLAAIHHQQRIRCADRYLFINRIAVG